jgi:3-deoxy-D-manno-octulosonate 8-phosphate phosphatase (KDO 8-P phosphatase)
VRGTADPSTAVRDDKGRAETYLKSAIGMGGVQARRDSHAKRWRRFSPKQLQSYDVGMSPGAEIEGRARKIKLFLMDVDGTITDGSVNLISLPDGGGVAEMKAFNSQDGAGLKLAHIMGIRTGFITGRKSPAVAQRAHELSVEFVYLGQATKMAAFEECMQKAGVREDEVAYMGDDLPDMPVAKRAGLAVAVSNAAAELKAVCHYITQARGGEGTAREVIELILKAQGLWEEAVPKAIA